MVGRHAARPPLSMKSHWQLEIDRVGGLAPRKLAGSTDKEFCGFCLFSLKFLKNRLLNTGQHATLCSFAVRCLQPVGRSQELNKHIN